MRRNSTLIAVKDCASCSNEVAVNAFFFGSSLDSLAAVARIVCANVVKITSRRWKAAYGIITDKIETRSLAQRLTGDQKRFRPVKGCRRSGSQPVGAPRRSERQRYAYR